MQKGLKKILIIPVYVAGFIVLGVLSGYLSFRLLSFSKTVEVPDLIGKTIFEANSLLNKKGLFLKVEGEDYDSSVTPGHIARQDVPAGNKVKEQRGIKVLISKGSRVSVIPALAGLSMEEAEEAVSRAGLKLGRVIRVHSSTIESGKVIAQMPTPEDASGAGPSQDIMEERHGFSIILSSGPYDAVYYCPDFAGKSREDAAGLAAKLGLNAEISGSGDKVVSQKPKPNTVMKTGETVHLRLEGG